MSTQARGDDNVKDMVIAGCRVHLAFHPKPNDRWSVTGRVECGIEENRGDQSFVTAAFDSRVAAEEAALRTVSGLLGHNVGRNTSRVRNRTEGGPHADDRASDS